MSASAVGALQAATIALLLADPGVAALVGDKVNDLVPGSTAAKQIVPPWIYFGPVGTKRSNNGCYRGWEIRQRLFAITDDMSRDAAWAIAEAIDLALDNAHPQLAEGFTLGTDLQMIDSGDIVDPTKPISVFTDVVAIVWRDKPLFATIV